MLQQDPQIVDGTAAGRKMEDPLLLYKTHDGCNVSVSRSPLIFLASEGGEHEEEHGQEHAFIGGETSNQYGVVERTEAKSEMSSLPMIESMESSSAITRSNNQRKCASSIHLWVQKGQFLLCLFLWVGTLLLLSGNKNRSTFLQWQSVVLFSFAGNFIILLIALTFMPVDGYPDVRVVDLAPSAGISVAIVIMLYDGAPAPEPPGIMVDGVPGDGWYDDDDSAGVEVIIQFCFCFLVVAMWAKKQTSASKTGRRTSVLTLGMFFSYIILSAVGLLPFMALWRVLPFSSVRST